MILDEAMRVSDGQVVTASALSTNSVDLGPVASKAGPRVKALLSVDVTAVGQGATFLLVQLISASAPDLLTHLRIVGATHQIPEAVLTAGMLPLVIEPNPDAADNNELWRRFLGVQFAVSGGPFVAGAFTIDFLLDPESFQSGPFAYRGGFEVA